MTSLPPQALDAPPWLLANRPACGIENGLHQRLDVSLNDDHCRVPNPNALRVLGRFRHLANSLFLEWRGRQPKPQPKSTTDFQAEMGEANLAKAIRFVTSKRPNL